MLLSQADDAARTQMISDEIALVAPEERLVKHEKLESFTELYDAESESAEEAEPNLGLIIENDEHFKQAILEAERRCCCCGSSRQLTNGA